MFETYQKNKLSKRKQNKVNTKNNQNTKTRKQGSVVSKCRVGACRSLTWCCPASFYNNTTMAFVPTYFDCFQGKGQTKNDWTFPPRSGQRLIKWLFHTKKHANCARNSPHQHWWMVRKPLLSETLRRRCQKETLEWRFWHNFLIFAVVTSHIRKIRQLFLTQIKCSTFAN